MAHRDTLCRKLFADVIGAMDPHTQELFGVQQGPVFFYQALATYYSENTRASRQVLHYCERLWAEPYIVPVFTLLFHKYLLQLRNAPLASTTILSPLPSSRSIKDLYQVDHAEAGEKDASNGAFGRYSSSPAPQEATPKQQSEVGEAGVKLWEPQQGWGWDEQGEGARDGGSAGGLGYAPQDTGQGGAPRGVGLEAGAEATLQLRSSSGEGHTDVSADQRVRLVHVLLGGLQQVFYTDTNGTSYIFLPLYQYVWNTCAHVSMHVTRRAQSTKSSGRKSARQRWLKLAANLRRFRKQFRGSTLYGQWPLHQIAEGDEQGDEQEDDSPSHMPSQDQPADNPGRPDSPTGEDPPMDVTRAYTDLGTGPLDLDPHTCHQLFSLVAAFMFFYFQRPILDTRIDTFPLVPVPAQGLLPAPWSRPNGPGLLGLLPGTHAGTADFVVAQVPRILKNVRSEASLVMIIQNLKFLKEATVAGQDLFAQLPGITHLWLQDELYILSTVGGPRYSPRAVRLVAGRALDVLYPAGKLTRTLVRQAFRAIHPADWLKSAGWMGWWPVQRGSAIIARAYRGFWLPILRGLGLRFAAVWGVVERWAEWVEGVWGVVGYRGGLLREAAEAGKIE